MKDAPRNLAFGVSAALAYALVSLALTTGAIAAIPSDWIKLRAGDAFTLRAPPGTRFAPAQGIDSFVGGFTGPNFKITFDYGFYSNDLTHLTSQREYMVSRAFIAGRPAVIVTGPGRKKWGCKDRLVAMYLVVKRSTWRAMETRLQMSGCTADPAAIDTLHAILRTVEFS